MTGPGSEGVLAAWLQRELGAAPVKELTVHPRSSQAVGFRLDDGRRVVVKLRHAPLARVANVLRVQGALFAARFPCPRPLTRASVVAGLTVHAEDLVEGGDLMLGSDEVTAPAFAAALAALASALERVRDVAEPPALSAPPWMGWWAQPRWGAVPRLPTFALSAAERVRAFMRRVDLPHTVGHTGWTSRNIRWVRGRLHVAYDWDSLSWLPEAVVVGAAAAVFPSDHQPVVASLAGSEVFLDEYERARGRRFSDEERAAAWAAGLLPVLYNARNDAIENRRPLVLDELPHQCEERLRRAGA